MGEKRVALFFPGIWNFTLYTHRYTPYIPEVEDIIYRHSMSSQTSEIHLQTFVFALQAQGGGGFDYIYTLQI